MHEYQTMLHIGEFLVTLENQLRLEILRLNYLAENPVAISTYKFYYQRRKVNDLGKFLDSKDKDIFVSALA